MLCDFLVVKLGSTLVIPIDRDSNIQEITLFFVFFVFGNDTVYGASSGKFFCKKQRTGVIIVSCPLLSCKSSLESRYSTSCPQQLVDYVSCVSFRKHSPDYDLGRSKMKKINVQTVATKANTQ